MYLPKICGNILRRHPSALAGTLLLASCGPEARPGPEVQVFAYQLDECELPAGDARIELEALGDFDPSNRTTDSLATDARGTALTFPPNTVGVQASLTTPRSSERFIALAHDQRTRAMPLLLWPEARACALTSKRSDYPVPGGGQGIGYSQAAGLVLVAGSNNSTSGAVSGALTFDTATGEVVVLPPGPRQLSRARAFPTVSAFGDGFLVAGGEDPTVSFDSGRRNLRRTAEIYDPESQAFEDDLIDLINPRSRHQALLLPNGDTALIGGITESASGERTALPNIEIVSPRTRSSREGPLLAEARIAPGVVTLSDGGVLVAGGENLAGELVNSVEWRTLSLAADGSKAFDARYDQAFVALPGGAVLAVGGCEERVGSSEQCGMCRRGCPPEHGWDAFWIDADREIVPFAVEHPVPRPQLITASEGAPFLVTEDAGGSPLLLRFDPWSRSFRPVNDAEGALPHPALPALALDAGAYVYVGETGARAQLWGRRFSTRNVYSHDSELIHATHPSNSTWPLHLAPGEAVQAVTGLVPGENESSPWVLELTETTAWLTDTSYADFELEVELAPGGTPRLMVNSERCSWPIQATSMPVELNAVRRGGVVTLSDADAAVECSVDEGRVRLGFAPAKRGEPARLTRIAVARGEPEP
jgi:hypothetical protein